MRPVSKHILQTAILALLLTLGSLGSASAQGYMPVRVKVYNTAEKDANGRSVPYDNVILYVFETEAEGLKASRQLADLITVHKQTGMDVAFVPQDECRFLNMAGSGGELYIDDVSTEGSILFLVESGDYNNELKMVRGKERITVEFNVNLSLEASQITVDLGGGPIDPGPISDDGDTLTIPTISYRLPGHMGRDDGRMVMQSYIVTPEDNDTLEFRKLTVMDGRDFHKTQLRRLSYNPDNDPLYGIAHKTPILSGNTKETSISSDKLYKTPEIRKGVLIMASLWMEDYNHEYFTDVFEVADTRRTWRPMQFLEYNGEPAQLDPMDPIYVKPPEKDKYPGEVQLPIQFAQGRATVDPNDAVSMHMLDSLRRRINAITREKGSTLRQVSVFGTSSPEGGYATNVALANERMKYIEAQIKAQIPSEKTASLRTSETDSRVASWDELADILVADGHISEADQIRAITSAYPGNIDAQNPHIYKLPFYDTLIKDNLSRLRMVNVKWVQEIYRKPSDEEILDKFYNQPEYREGGIKEFTDYEYWVLLRLVTETEDLEQICKRAIARDTQKFPGYEKRDLRWPLPANLLASSYLKRGIVDTTILAPFVTEGRRYDQPLTQGRQLRLNPAPVVANQVLMMLRGEYYNRAVRIAGILKDHPDYQLLYAVARCKAGYWKNQDESQKYYDIAHDSSPLNSVVMDLAKGYYNVARFGLDNLDPDAPLTHYLRAQLECMEFYGTTNKSNFSLMADDVQEKASRNLVKSFRKDSTYIDIAKADWFIFKGLLERALIEYENPSTDEDEDDGEDEERIMEILENMSEEEKNALIMKGTNHYEDLTDEEIKIYEKLSGF